MPETTGRRICQGFRKDGEPCGAVATKDGWCCWRSPNVPDELKLAWATKGGFANRPNTLPAETKDIRFQTAEGCLRILEETGSQVRRGDLSVNVANSVGYLTSVAVKVIEAALLERRIKTLEKAQARRRRG
jgi:hypothetical protein